jgi:hypothetical protein
MSSATRITGIIRDIAILNGEEVIILGALRCGTNIIREHTVLRKRDFNNDCQIIGRIAIGAEVLVVGSLGQYPDKLRLGHYKACVKGISKIQRI